MPKTKVYKNVDNEDIIEEIIDDELDVANSYYVDEIDEDDDYLHESTLDYKEDYTDFEQESEFDQQEEVELLDGDILNYNKAVKPKNLVEASLKTNAQGERSFSFYDVKSQTGKRIDVFLCEQISDLSRNSVQILIKDGAVLVNEQVVKPNYKIRALDMIDVFIKKSVEMEVLPEDIPIEILYEDADLIVVNKAKGMVVHPAVGNYNKTLVNALLHHCKGELSGINGVLRPGIVHRIDKDTSGVLVVAKTNVAHASLSKQLEEHTMTRVYLAIVYNGIKEDELTINKPLGRSKLDRKKMGIRPDGKRAVTHVKVVERLKNYNLIEARLETGRTHQIRVHLASIGNPLLGDTIYGKGNSKFNLNGQTLHAKTLGFNHPTTGEYMEFSAEIPEYFEMVLNNLRNS